MKIQVSVDLIHADQMKQIIMYYNQIKPHDSRPLERLNRCEGGFQIRISDEADDQTPSNTKQMRWSRKCLVPHYSCVGFNHQETMMLFEAMSAILGEKVVELIL